MAEYWPMLDALMAGTAAMRKAGKSLLPQWPNEEDDSYKARLAVATLHPVYKRTVSVNAARPFSKPMIIGDQTPPTVLEWLDDIDLQGSSFAALSIGLLYACLGHGLVGVLVDYPKAEGVKTKAAEKAAGIRPYLTSYPATHILGWRTEQVRGGVKLTQLRLLESVEEADGAYATKFVEQVRVLTPGSWATYRLDPKNPENWYENESGTTSLDFVPFVFFYGQRKSFGVGLSPLLDLAYQNVEHWQSASDQQTVLHVARVPVLFGKGLGDTEITIGASSATISDNADAELMYVEHTGAAIASGRDALLDLEDRMRSTGAELISQKPAYTTATQVSSEAEASKSVLQQIVEVFEESLELCLNYMAAWVGEQQTAEVELYKDYSAATDTDPQSLATAKDAGVISGQTMFEELQRRDVISSDKTWCEEQNRMQADSQITNAS